MKVIDRDGTEREIADYAPQIARNLGASYPGVTADDVRAQLKLPYERRDIIGMFAFGMIEDADFLRGTDDESEG